VPDAYTSAGFDPLMLMLDGRVSALPRIGFNFVDVRDVAAIHIAALQGPSSIGKRVIAAGRYTTLQEVAAIVRKDYPSYPVPWAALPHWMSRLIALRNPAMRLVLPELGVQRNFDGQSGRELLGRNYIPVIRSVADTIESLIEAGLITR
jgi:dihydroflavonol-4-reductase